MPRVERALGRPGIRGDRRRARGSRAGGAGRTLPLLFDPLDGSSSIDTNGAVGTIFSILRCPAGVEKLRNEHFLQPGTRQVAAGFALCGPSTLLILTTGHGARLHPRPRLRRVPPHPPRHASAGGSAGFHHQHVQQALLDPIDLQDDGARSALQATSALRTSTIAAPRARRIARPRRAGDRRTG